MLDFGRISSRAYAGKHVEESTNMFSGFASGYVAFFIVSFFSTISIFLQPGSVFS